MPAVYGSRLTNFEDAEKEIEHVYVHKLDKGKVDRLVGGSIMLLLSVVLLKSMILTELKFQSSCSWVILYVEWLLPRMVHVMDLLRPWQGVVAWMLAEYMLVPGGT